MSTVLLF